jgi:hypothetical protein
MHLLCVPIQPCSCQQVSNELKSPPRTADGSIPDDDMFDPPEGLVSPGKGRSRNPRRNCECGCDKPYTRRGSVEWFKAHMDNPLAVGADGSGGTVRSKVTTREMVLALLELHVQHNVSKGLMDTILAMFSEAIPGIHFLPPSIHLLRKVTDTPEHTKFHVHVCSTDGCPGHDFGHVPPKDEWPGLVDEKCPKCEAKRFKTSVIAGTCGCGEDMNWI